MGKGGGVERRWKEDCVLGGEGRGGHVLQKREGRVKSHWRFGVRFGMRYIPYVPYFQSSCMCHLVIYAWCFLNCESW